jgi:hypothetical protein
MVMKKEVSCTSPETRQIYGNVFCRPLSPLFFFMVPKHKTKHTGEKEGAELNLHTPSESWQCMYIHYQCLCNPYEMTVKVNEAHLKHYKPYINNAAQYTNIFLNINVPE